MASEHRSSTDVDQIGELLSLRDDLSRNLESAASATCRFGFDRALQHAESAGAELLKGIWKMRAATPINQKETA